MYQVNWMCVKLVPHLLQSQFVNSKLFMYLLLLLFIDNHLDTINSIYYITRSFYIN